MNLKMKLTSAALAAFAAGGAACAPHAHTHSAGGTVSAPGAAPAASGAKGECSGVNACKGQGACGGSEGGVSHECAGNNSCKGKGWLSLTKSECDGKGGTFKPG